jgi:hypothetical protein
VKRCSFFLPIKDWKREFLCPSFDRGGEFMTIDDISMLRTKIKNGLRRNVNAGLTHRVLLKAACSVHGSDFDTVSERRTVNPPLRAEERVGFNRLPRTEAGMLRSPAGYVMKKLGEIFSPSFVSYAGM